MKNYIPANNTSFADSESLKAVGKEIVIGNDYEKGGFTLWSDSKRMIASVSDSHMIAFGTTGSRKTRSCLIPSAFAIAGGKEKMNMVIHDTKGTVPEYTYNYFKKQGYKIVVLNFRDPGRSDHYNVFDSVTDLMSSGNTSKAMPKLKDICRQTFEPSLKNAKDTYWISTVCTFFSNLYLAQGELCGYSKKYMNFANVISLYHWLKSSRANQRSLFQYLNMHDAQSIVEGLNELFDQASDTAKNLFSMVNNVVDTLTSVAPITYKSDFKVADMTKKPTVVFIVTPDESDEYNFLVSLFIKTIYGELIDLASSFRDSRLPITTLFLIDEFASLPQINSFNNMISAARSRNIRFYLLCQTYAQLKSIYGGSQAVNIVNNCEHMLCLRSNDNELEDILRKSVGKMTLPYSCESVELINYGTLRSLDKGQAIIVSQGIKNPVMVRLPDLSEYSFEYRPSNCLTKTRRNHIVRTDFSSIIKNYCSNVVAESDSEIREIEREKMIMKEMQNRLDELVNYEKIHNHPQMIVSHIRHIPKKETDILIQRVKYGKELELYNNLLHITQAASNDVAENIFNLYGNSDEILLRCYTEEQYQEAISTLSNICAIKTFRDGANEKQPIVHELCNDERLSFNPFSVFEE